MSPQALDTPILIVEDDELLREALRLLLEDAGYRVLEAGNAAEAEANIALETPGLIILDMGLPDRPGLEIAREVRQDSLTAKVPLVALTGRALPADQRALTEAGCNLVFCKPVEPRRLIDCLAGLLGTARD